MPGEEKCPFCDYGCGFTGDRTGIQNHIREEAARHLTILCDHVVDLKRQTTQTFINLERVGRRMEDLSLKTESLRKLYGAQFLWKIENYQIKFNEAKAGAKTTIYSSPFVTGRHGYKMVVSVCLYGDGKVRGQYMSVFASICRGDYDALLVWPFSHSITFTLLDQCADPAARRNITYTVKPNTTKENRPFLGRPTSERNASFGAAKLCELDMLDQLDYVKDDAIFIKVDVDTEDMMTI